MDGSGGVHTLILASIGSGEGLHREVSQSSLKPLLWPCAQSAKRNVQCHMVTLQRLSLPPRSLRPHARHDVVQQVVIVLFNVVSPHPPDCEQGADAPLNTKLTM